MNYNDEKDLVSYLTKTLKYTSQDDTEGFEGVIFADRDKWTDYVPSNWNNFRFEGIIEANEDTSNLSILYGGYIDTSNNVKGIIILINDNFEPVKTFYKYSNGTDLRYIQNMKQAEDGTFYFIDDTAFSYSQRQQAITSQKRFVMVNNMSVKNRELDDYILGFRTSYILPDAYKNFYCQNMFKNPNASNYIFFGDSANSNSPYTYNKLTIFGLTINVGTANEWTSYINAQSSSLYGGAYAMYNNEMQVAFRCLYTPLSTSDKSIKCISKTYTGNPSDSSIHTFTYDPYIDEGNQKKQSVFLNLNEVYYVQNNSNWGLSGTPEAKYIGLYKYNFNNGTQTTLYEKYLGNYDFTKQEYIMIDINNDELYIQYVNNYQAGTVDCADYYVQRYNGKWNPIFILGQMPFLYNLRSFFVKNNYNLVQLYSYGLTPVASYWFNMVLKEDYNPNNYNGRDYVNSDVLVPKKVKLFSSDYDFVFARNLYNVSKQNNMTMSSVEIPSAYLNGVTINDSNLISKTNSYMIRKNTAWTKNIYEIVDLNFLNTITIEDEDTGVEYLNGAIKLNNATTDGGNTNYQNTPCIKYRINYEDNTTGVYSLSWITINNNNKKTHFNLSVSKPIKSIDLISNDESTIYLTITGNFEVGKNYLIEQKVRIGNKVIATPLIYNNQDIKYNNQLVNTYIEEE